MRGALPPAMAVFWTLSFLGGQVIGQTNPLEMKVLKRTITDTDPCTATDGTSDEKVKACKNKCAAVEDGYGRKRYGGGCCMNKKDDLGHSKPLNVLVSTIALASCTEEVCLSYCNCCEVGYNCGGGSGCENKCDGSVKYDCGPGNKCDVGNKKCVCDEAACDPIVCKECEKMEGLCKYTECTAGMEGYCDTFTGECQYPGGGERKGRESKLSFWRGGRGAGEVRLSGGEAFGESTSN